MLRTAAASAAVALLAVASAGWLTNGLRTFTEEGARRHEVAREPVPAPAVAMRVPGLGVRALPELLTADGAATIVDFIYTDCLAACAALGTAFQQLQDRVRADGMPGADGGRGPVRLLSISFDPARDDPAALARYAASMKARADTWRFATPADPGELAALLRRFRVVVIPDGLGGYEHNAALLVVDPRGRLVRIFDYGQLDEALAFARAVAARDAAGDAAGDGRG